ncbi:hypothetical protein SteCoe_16897 [Stentor coeruleus]|uniref:Translin-associated factor X-interacting protein 1 N-terminal domain-containing protein n=1 Tax=Stentor coeruleus TaxID=5963 RepID=A0A1R2C0A0_9CILI|nr:hypothetical protein SteCoe_16897 [Stentor coeruleus]
MSRLIKNSMTQEKLKKESNNSFQKSLQPLSPNMDNLCLKKNQSFQLKQFSNSPYASTKKITLKTLDKVKKKMRIGNFQDELLKYRKNSKVLSSDSTKKLFSAYSLPGQNDLAFKDKDLSLDKYMEFVKKIENQKDRKGRFEVLKAVFSHIIEETKEFSTIFKFIKNEYETFIKDQANDFEKQKKYLKDIENVKILLSTELEQTLKEKEEIKRSFDSLHKNYINISDKLLKIINANVNTLEKTDENWTNICYENQVLKEAFQKLTDDHDYYKYKAQKMMKILIILEKKGIPIEKIYKNEVKNQSEIDKYECCEPILDDTEHENIVTGKNEICKMPSKIPGLDLGCLEANRFSSSDSQGSSYMSSAFSNYS